MVGPALDGSVEVIGIGVVGPAVDGLVVVARLAGINM